MRLKRKKRYQKPQVSDCTTGRRHTSRVQCIETYQPRPDMEEIGRPWSSVRTMHHVVITDRTMVMRVATGWKLGRARCYYTIASYPCGSGIGEDHSKRSKYAPYAWGLRDEP